ncbi:MAG: hypothetical protein KA072_00620 [Thermoanaerobaculaceae bacterium]|nr:hypothetical protein [Thermoanaerobaculaceae bacterium]MDI9621244.1 hypothetical protein [Acidobacteriota bacterium]NLH12399.1 hypothetical protein [Holophagae bacterium]HPW54224.1 hypothetical protein [Thermoanaerobaculaceae bacterium]
MSVRHLADDELDLVLGGEPLAAEREAHLRDCIVCRRRRDAFLGVVAEARAEDPDEATRARVREAALAAWQSRPVVHWWRWAAAAVAVAVLGLVPLLHNRTVPLQIIDTEAVMAEVDAALARDPLAAFASEDVVDEIVPVGESTGEGSAS